MESGASLWVKKVSSKHPGKFYYFNVKSGESSWIAPENQSSFATKRKKRCSDSYSEKLLKIKTSGICKSSRTPAQDRLNKLQTKLVTEQIKNNKVVFAKDKLNKEEKRSSVNGSDAPTNNCQKTDVESSTSLGENGIHMKLRKSNKDVLNCKQSKSTQLGKRSYGTVDLSTLSKIPRLTIEALAKIPKLITDKLSKLSNEKAAVSVTLNNQKRWEPQVSVVENREVSPVVHNSKVAADIDHVNSSGKQSFCDASDNRNDDIKSINVPNILQSSKSTLLFKVGKFESANDRLVKLRKALDEQRKSLEKSSDSLHSGNVSSLSSIESYKECSPMEWEEMQGKINEKVRQDNEKEENDLLGDFYNIVNRNLLKICAEQNNDCFVKESCFYFVVDTNVFLRNLTFVDDLRKLNFSGTECSIIFVPYSVLQELDRIKQRSNAAMCTSAVRAIKYLNKRFESKDERVKGQSAMEANRHLISIENADDNILNCCLQIKTKTDKILLLTNDVNLRNKAMCNGIPVSSKGELDSTENLNT